jgi:hypothetical protein
MLFLSSITTDNRELTVREFSQTLFQTKYLYALSSTKKVANEALISPAITQFRHREIKKVSIIKINIYSFQVLQHCGCVRKNTSHTIQIDKSYFKDKKKYMWYGNNAYGGIGLNYIN